MSTTASLALLAAVLLGIAASAVLARYANVLDAIHGGKSPEVFAERAREVIHPESYWQLALEPASGRGIPPNRIRLSDGRSEGPMCGRAFRFSWVSRDGYLATALALASSGTTPSCCIRPKASQFTQ